MPAPDRTPSFFFKRPTLLTILRTRVNVACNPADQQRGSALQRAFLSGTTVALSAALRLSPLDKSTRCKRCQAIEKNGQTITTGSFTMKKIRRAEWLAAVAIITSATVLQIREHLPSPETTRMSAQAPLSSCGMTNHGLLLAACEPTRGESRQNRATLPAHGAPKIWV